MEGSTDAFRGANLPIESIDLDLVERARLMTLDLIKAFH